MRGESDMKYGSVVRDIRESRQIKMEDVTDDVISQPFLSRFERGQSDISLNRFDHLLKQLHLTPAEFFGLSEQVDDNQTPDAPYFGYFHDFFLTPEIISNPALLRQKLTQIKKLEVITHVEYQKRPSRWHLISWRGAQSCLNHLYLHVDPSKVISIDTSPVQSYLLGLTTWTAIDILLFGYFAEYMTPDFKMQLLTLVMKHIPKSSLLGSWDHFLLSIVFASFQQFMVDQQFPFAHDTLGIMQKLSTHFDNTNFEIILLFMNGWYHYDVGKGERKDAIREMENAISIMTILHHNDDADDLHKLKQQITGTDPTTITSDISL